MWRLFLFSQSGPTAVGNAVHAVNAHSELKPPCLELSRKSTVNGGVLQANSAQELPEALLGAVRLNGFGVEDPALQTKLYP